LVARGPLSNSTGGELAALINATSTAYGYRQKRINGPQNPVQPKRTGPRLARLEKGSSLRVADGPTETETESASLCQVETRGSQVPSTERRGKRTSSSAAMAKQGAKKMKDGNKKRLDLLLRIILVSNVSTRLQSPLPSRPSRIARDRSAHHFFDPYRLLPSNLLFVQLVG